MFINKAAGDFSAQALEIMRISRQKNINSVFSVSSVVKENFKRLPCPGSTADQGL